MTAAPPLTLIQQTRFRHTGFDREREAMPGPVHLVNPRYPFGNLTLCGVKFKGFNTDHWQGSLDAVTCSKCKTHHANGTSRAWRAQR